MNGRIGTELISCVYPPCAACDVPLDEKGRRFCATCMRPLSGPRFGPALGYCMESFLGDGFFADVFAVRDLGTSRRYAAKLYRADPAKRAAARHEARAQHALVHARLPALRESFEEGAWLFVVMEFAAGPNLRDEVTVQGPLAIDSVVRFATELCEVFDYIAASGWTYRDLHPKNIHRRTHKGAMLVDLDGARTADWPAQVAGRAGYRAPELELQGSVSPACDVYSLAGCVHFGLTGEDPPEQPGALPALRGPLLTSPALLPVLERCRSADPLLRPSARALRFALQTSWRG